MNTSADASSHRPTEHHEAPKGHIEETLASIWQEVLHVQHVGRHDNFIDLGAGSLHVMQMMEHLALRALETEIRNVYDCRTLADLAATLRPLRAAQDDANNSSIPTDNRTLTPEMLTCVNLDQDHIDSILELVPGGSTNVQDIYPLTPLQEGILFHHLLKPQRGDTYVLPTLLAVSSREKLDELIAALQTTINRHDVLRSAVFWARLPQPIQVVCRRANLPVEHLTLDPQRDRIEQMIERMKPERQKLELRQAPLLRLQIAPAADDREWYALLQIHHIICDAQSLATLIGEVRECLEGRAHELPPSAAFRGHVVRSLAQARTDDGEALFRRKLGHINESTAPFGLLDVHGNGNRIHETRQIVEPALDRRLRVQARRLGVSAATILHAAWAIVVARTSGRDEVVFGTVLLGRLQSGATSRRTVGMFLNTLPFRLRLDKLTPEALISQTRDEVLDLLSHEQTSLSVAQRCSGMSGPEPLFTTLLNYRHEAPLPETEWIRPESGIRVVASQEWTNYPITLSIDDMGDHLMLTAQTDRRIDAERVATYLYTATHSLVAALEQSTTTPVLQLPVLPDHELSRLLNDFNATKATQAEGLLVHELFEHQVRLTPDAVALTDAELTLTYAEINNRANQLSAYLRSRGVGPDKLVALCVGRSPEMVLAIIATLKAGGAYLPLDPTHPADRLQYVLEDSAPQVVLTEAQYAAQFSTMQAEVVFLKEALEQSAGYTAENTPSPALGVQSSHLTYVIYTSGSTGHPKGIEMPHQCLVNLLEWQHRALPITVGTRVLQFAALSFDVAFQEIFSTLCYGGNLHLIKESLRTDPWALMQFLHSHSIERLFLPPVMLQTLAECIRSSGEAPPDRLLDVITAGEQLRISPEVAGLFKRLNRCRLHNHYGPTETHVVTASTLPPDPTQWPTLPPIGQPISNVRIYLLDQRLQPVPLGLPGEIFIGGANVARGYLRKPTMTEQRFIADPFSTGPDARLYRTGDMARYRADGTLEYLGRNDDQVKVRGYRIELGEIEAQLAKHPLVREAVVVARTDVTREKRLVAYVTVRGNGSPTAQELGADLSRALPEYMVPTAFVILERLPLNPSGKLDRRALPSPGLNAFTRGQYEAPQGEIETALADIWQELLQVERVGRRDNYFALGGQSLLGMRLVVRIAQTFSVQLPVNTVFRYPTIRSMAQMIAAMRGSLPSPSTQAHQTSCEATGEHYRNFTS